MGPTRVGLQLFVFFYSHSNAFHHVSLRFVNLGAIITFLTLSPILLSLLINLCLWDTFYGLGPLRRANPHADYDPKSLVDSMLARRSPLTHFLLPPPTS